MHYLVSALVLLALFACGRERAVPVHAGNTPITVFSVAEGRYVMSEKVVRSADEWKKVLSPEAFHILREEGTERAFTGHYWNHHAHGIYRCAGCGLDLFRSQEKFESGTGWPSFTAPVAKENVILRPDNRLFMRRTEVLCSRCEGHLGHVFDDGPPPTGKRYCLNSPALDFVAGGQDK